MRYRNRIKWASLIMTVLLLITCSLAEASPSKHQKQMYKPAKPLLIMPGDNARTNFESKMLLAEIKKQDSQVKQLNRSVDQLNHQLQKQTSQLQSNKVQLSAREVQTLREHLQVVKNSSQRLASGEKKYQGAQQQWQQFQHQKRGLEKVSNLQLVKAAQTQKINELTSLQRELQLLISLLADKG